MEFYKSCRTLSIYNFDKIIETNNFCFLIKGYDEYSNEIDRLCIGEEIIAKEIFKDILYEYSELTFNRDVLQNFNSQIYIEQDEFRLNAIKEVLRIYAINEDLEVLCILNNLGFNINIEGNIEEQIKSIITTVKRLNTKVNILKLKHSEKFNKKTNEDTEHKTSLESQCVHLEISLKLSYQIDTKITSVSKWISMFDAADKMNKPKN